MSDEPQRLGQLIDSQSVRTATSMPRKTLTRMDEITPEMRERLRLRDLAVDQEMQALTAPSPERRFANIVGAAYANCRLGNFRINRDPHRPWSDPQIRQAKEVIERLTAMEQRIVEAVNGHRRQLILYGVPGAGKDHLAAALMWSAFTAGLLVKWCNGTKFEAHVRDQLSFDSMQPAGVWLRQWTSPDVLTISDPDGERSRVSDDVRTALYNVIDGRIREGKPTWITINGQCESDCEQRLGARIWDRLRQSAWVMHCDWPSGRTPRGTV